MNLRSEWINNGSIFNRFYTVEETVNEVKENFDIRRLYSTEGKDITINNVTEKCLVQTSSNPLRDLDDQRKIHCPLTMIISRGDYVEYENAVWLITTNVANIDDAYQSARMSMCNWQLKWQNPTGEIISRWAYISSASKYNDGETGNNVITLGSDQLSVEIPIDNESLNIKRKIKFFIDNNGIDPTVYELTGTNNVTNTYNGHGATAWIVKECAYSPTANDLKYGVCNYISPTAQQDPGENPDKTTVFCKVTYKGKNTINAGRNAKMLTAQFTDNDGNIISDVDFTWGTSIINEFAEFLHTETTRDKKFKVWLDFDDLLAGNYIKVFVYDSNGTELTSETFEIGGTL